VSSVVDLGTPAPVAVGAGRTTSANRGPSIALNQYMSRPGVDESSASRDAQIVKMQRLISVTDDADPQKPDFHFRLAELYASKQRQSQNQGNEKESQQWLLEAAKSYMAATKFKNYERGDAVDFGLASLLLFAKKEGQAREYFMRLIKDYPASKYIPDAYLTFAESYFDKGEVDRALKFYEKVEQFPKSSVYPYAVYKKAWCYVNLRDDKVALETFVAVLRATQDERGGVNPALRLALQDESRKGIVRTYADVGAPSTAPAFFQRVGGESWRKMLDLLAAEYTERGQVNEAAQVRKLGR
jgi:TolA-binding protein